VTRRWRANARLLIGVLAGGLGLWLTFRGVAPRDLGTVLSRLDGRFVVWAIASIVVTLSVTTVRWRLLLRSAAPDVPWRATFESIVVGQMLNIILPLRIGDFVRACAVSHIDGVPLGGVVATIALEKVADLLAQGAAMAVLLVRFTLPVALAGSARVSIAVGVLALAVAVAAARSRHRTIDWISHTPLVPQSFRGALVHHGGNAVEGLAVLRTFPEIVALCSLTVLTVGLAAGTNYLLFKAFDLDLPPSAALLLLVVLQFGNAPVSTPGNLGVYHYLTVVVLSAFSVDRAVAVGYAIVLYGVALVPKIVLGSIIIAAPGHGSRFRTMFMDSLVSRAQP